MDIKFRLQSDPDPCEKITNLNPSEMEEFIRLVKDHGYYCEDTGDLCDVETVQFTKGHLEIIGRPL